jgi:hypothetical protein
MHTHSPQTQLTLGSVFITATLILSCKSSSVISLTLSTWGDVTLVSLQDPGSPCSKSIWFCKTNKLITAVPSHVTKQGYITTILHSITFVTHFLQVYFPATFNITQFFSFFQCTNHCCSISQALNCPLHNLKGGYHAQRSFAHVPTRGQRNPVHISNLIFVILTFKQPSELGTPN